MAKIHKLSPQLADMIAAGEVVERPASVIKELVENSIDAGATRITVEIQNGGITFMRVTDNGCGIAKEDAPTAFLRHATSKISCAEDLGSIGTMGFRGEALAAISAVSKIDLLTRAAEEELGTSIRVEAGNVLEVQATGCPQGTTMVVRELFYNTPARMKFLKRDSVEGSYVGAAVQRQALGHPEIAFRLIRDGKSEFSTPGDGKLHSAVYNVMGRASEKEMVDICRETGGVRVTGCIGKPTASRGSRSYQYFYVNGRYVKSPMMMTALEHAYRNQLMVGRFPICVLHVEVPAAAVDVNVHPAKTEIKFLRENDVFDAIYYGALAALNQAEAKPEMVLPEQKTPVPAQKLQQQTVPAASGNRAGGEFYQRMTAEKYRALYGSQLVDSSDAVAPEAQKPSGQKPAEAADRMPASQTVAGTGGATCIAPAQSDRTQTRAQQLPAGGVIIHTAARHADPVLHDSMHRIPSVEPAAAQTTPVFSGHTAITDYGSFIIHTTGEAAASGPAVAEPEAACAAKTAETVPTEYEVPQTQLAEPEQEESGQTALELPGALYPGAEKMPQPEAVRQPENPKHPEAEPYRIVGEVLKTYIIVEQGDAMLMIDKHAAHERILFEKLKKQEREVMTQLLLTPIQAEFAPEETAVLQTPENLELLANIGFELEDFGGGTTVIRAIPADIAESQAEATLSELAQQLLTGRRPDRKEIYDEMLHTVACKAAIKGGWDTDPLELQALVAELMKRDDIKYCPHGRPVCIRLSRYNLEKQFKRT